MKPPRPARNLKTTSACMKKPSGATSAKRCAAYRRKCTAKQKKRKEQNVKARARIAERKKTTYRPRSPELLKVATQARAAELLAKGAFTMAQSAKSESARNSSETKLAKALALRALARAERAHERLDADDHEGGFCTPPRERGHGGKGEM